jgi:hypothetical protein
MDLADDRDRQQTLVNAIKDLPVSQNARIFFTS